MEFNIVTKKEQKPIKKLAHEIIAFLHDKKKKEGYVFTTRLVGSGALNAILKDDKGFFDLDYQILLTQNSKHLNNPTKIKENFKAILDSYNKNYYKNRAVVQNSTTAITFIDKQNKFHIDFVLIKTYPENNKIVRRNNKIETLSINEFTWNDLPKYHDAYMIFKSWDYKNRRNFIEEKLIPLKEKYKALGSNHPDAKSSSQIFIEEVPRYGFKKRNS